MPRTKTVRENNTISFGPRYSSHVSGYNVGRLKEASIPQDAQSETYQTLRDPYTFSMKIRFEEAYRLDPVIRAAINKKTAFVLGKELKTVFDLVDSFINPAEGRAALNIAMSDQEMVNAKRIIDRVHRRVNFQQKLKAAYIQAKVFGRSALLIEAPKTADGTNGLPFNLKVLSSKLLGQVRVDERSWAIKQVQYNINAGGLNSPFNYLDAGEIVYFTNNDYHISPYTIHYGLSDIEPLAHISEVNRIINEEDLKEINYGMWSGFGLVKMPTTRNVGEVNAFLQSFQPGKWTAVSQDLTVEVHELTKDLASLLTERKENEQLMLRQLAVPAALLGFEDIQNFATLQEVMLAWKESTLEEERTWLNSIVEPQWFDPMLATILNIDDFNDMKIKIMLGFEDIALENMKDKAVAVIPLYEAGILPQDKALEILGFDDVADQIRVIQSKKEVMANQMKQQLVSQGYDPQAVAQQAKSPGEQPVPINPPATSAQGLTSEVEDDRGVTPEKQF